MRLVLKRLVIYDVLIQEELSACISTRRARGEKYPFLELLICLYGSEKRRVEGSINLVERKQLFMSVDQMGQRAWIASSFKRSETSVIVDLNPKNIGHPAPSLKYHVYGAYLSSVIATVNPRHAHQGF